MPEASPSFALNCPKCDSRMDRVTIDRMVVDRCPGCGALWFDVGEVERVLSMKRKAASELDSGAKGTLSSLTKLKATNLRCPRDRDPLRPRTYPDQSHIEVMECPTCHGMLLDAGELKDASAFTLAERVKSFFS